MAVLMGMVILISAGDEGIEALDLMDQPVLEQEIERTVHRHRRRVGSLGLQFVQQRVGAKRTAAINDKPEHAATDFCEPRAMAGADFCGLIKLRLGRRDWTGSKIHRCNVAELCCFVVWTGQRSSA